LKKIKTIKEECLQDILEEYEVTEFDVNLGIYLQKHRDFEEELALWKTQKN
jgi:hypothetical protein